MDDKIKVLVIIGLAGILGISIFLNLQVYGAKKSLEQELEFMRAENASLTKKVEEAKKENKKLQEQVSTLEADLSKTSQQKEELAKQKEELQKQYDAALKEKEKLLEKAKGEGAAFSAEAPAAAGTQAEQNYWAGILKIKTDLEMQLKNLQASNDQLKRDKGTLEMDLNNIMHEKRDLEDKLQYNTKMVDGMASELVKEKNLRFALQEKLNSIKSENASLRRQLNGLTNDRMKLEKKLAQLTDEKAALERQLNEADLFLKERLSTITDAKQQMEIIRSGVKPASATGAAKKESVELPPIVVRSQPEAAESALPKSAVEEEPRFGSILSVNRDHHFVVIDLGESAGVRVGDVFQVYKGRESIATIEVIQTRKAISACDIKRETKPISAGDSVR